MIRAIADFLAAWQYESGATLKVFRNLTDASLSQRVTPDGRSLGFLAWHITTSINEMMAAAGVAHSGPGGKDPEPSSAAEIAAAYEKAAAALAQAVPAAWTDAQLPEKIPMYGEMWPRSQVLGALIAHQCHHRGQMTVLMRQAGLAVPGVYGPAKEEWTAYGMPPQK